jgi:hypothetical protein
VAGILQTLFILALVNLTAIMLLIGAASNKRSGEVRIQEPGEASTGHGA